MSEDDKKTEDTDEEIEESDEQESEEQEIEESDNIKPVIAKSTKKRPGRPKKPITKKTVPKLGIVCEPSNLKAVNDPRLVNIFELLYDNPIMFKKIFTLFKSMFVENIRMRLEKKFIKMYAVDHTDSNQIYIKIYGDKMNRYYTNKVLEFGLGPSNIQKILQTLNKDISKVQWFTNVQYERSKIKIGLSNDEMEEDSIYTVDLDQIDEYNWSIEDEIALEEEYPLKFELPFKYFKKKVTDFKLLGDIMKIEKHGEGPLRLSYNFTNKKGDQNTYYRNPAKLNLCSLIDQGEIFSTSVYLDYIKPLSGSLIADTIHISACVDQKLIFTALLDQDEKQNKEKVAGTERCQIKVLTKIVKAKKDDDTD
jgi:hypothetical protein